MKAIVATRHGKPEVLTLKDVPDPPLEAGKLLIAVRASGVNFADILARLGVYDPAPPPPFIPGIEIAGVVEAAGEGVANFRPGDRVMAFCPFGGYAEKASIPASYAQKIPEEMGFSEAAALPVQYLTAYYGLFHLAHLRAGEALLIHAAAGGVGVACLQLGSKAGAKLFATVGSLEKASFVRELCPGARTILYGSEDFSEIVRRETDGKGPSVVMDSVGGRTFRKGWKILAPGGRYVLFGAATAVKPGAISKLAALFRLMPMLSVNPLKMIGENKGLFGFNLFYLAGEEALLHRAMDHLMEMRREGVVRPKVTLSLPLERAAEAHRRLQTRQTMGKVVLIV